MAELIDKQAFGADLKDTYNALQKIYDGLSYTDEQRICGGQLCTLMEVMIRLKDWPTIRIADYLIANGVTVQKQGRWEEHKPTGFLCCSTCKDVYINSEWLVDGKWNYCPNCGAKMEVNT